MSPIPKEDAVSTPPRILLVDDEADMRWVLSNLFREAGYLVAEAADGAEALACLQQARPDVVLTDLRMPGIDGQALLDELSRIDSDLPVILLSAVDQVDSAVRAIQHGAFDWQSKPFDRERLLRTVGRAAAKRRIQRELRFLQGQQNPVVDFGDSKAAGRLTRTMELVARQDTMSVLIVGPSGTGKEVVARTLHKTSPRADHPFVAIDCGALPESLMESQLFGHRRGAFTGADQDRPGLFRMADKGTLFLDELGNLPLALQGKLLRALQERTVTPVGGGEALPFDARLLAATNLDLESAVRNGTFRIDLYHRVAEFVLRIPTLEERPEDILPFAERFLCEAASEMQRKIHGFTSAAETWLRTARWPGNLRELRNAVRRAVVLCAGTEIDVLDFTSPDGRATTPDATSDLPLAERLRRASETLEADILQKALAAHDGNKAAAARALQIDYTTLHRKLKRHGLSRPDGPT